MAIIWHIQKTRVVKKSEQAQKPRKLKKDAGLIEYSPTEELLDEEFIFLAKRNGSYLRVGCLFLR
ncbi:MAG: hypothetical protein K940chlam9_01287 [Chlamydiae bacterium]|nr:hypothetical protein [Chlamydiota bacterium]